MDRVIGEEPMIASEMPHIVLDDRGVAWIDKTNVKVIEVVQEKLAYGWSPEQMMDEHPELFTLAQLYAALAFYYDHQAAFDAEIERIRREYEEARAQNQNTPAIQKLRRSGLIP
jgi:uncharacterized protein (DUF433 family)